MSTTYEQERTETQKEIDAEILENVKQGLVWLEKKHGPGWEDKIDLKTFDIRMPDRCVIGQVYGNYNDLFAYDERGRAANLGFNISEDQIADNLDEKRDLWDELQEAWVHVLTPRVEAVS